MSTSSIIYTAVIWELRKAIFARGITMQECDDLSGNQDGYTAKLLHPDTHSGRQARWDILDNLLLAVFPGGFTLRIKPDAKTMPNPFGTVDRIRQRGGIGRLPIRDYASFAGHKSWLARKAKMKPGEWERHCRKAARARWKRKRQEAS